MPFHILKLEIVSCPDRAHKNEKHSQVVFTAFGMPKIWPKNLLALVFLFPLELNVPQICSYQYEYWKVEAFCWENISSIYPSQFYHCQDTSRSKCILGSRSESKRKQVQHVATQTVTCISYILIQCTGKHQSWLVWYLSTMHNNVMFDLCCQAYDLKASKPGESTWGTSFKSEQHLRVFSALLGSMGWQMRKRVGPTCRSARKYHRAQIRPIASKKWKETCCLQSKFNSVQDYSTGVS